MVNLQHQLFTLRLALEIYFVEALHGTEVKRLMELRKIVLVKI
jgi:hypothetical protein